MVAVELIGVSKSYDKGRFAVKDVNLKIDDHDFVVLVGPSGCGKTTLLNLIAGLVDITSASSNLNSRNNYVLRVPYYLS